jgi:hypothetical protein
MVSDLQGVSVPDTKLPPSSRPAPRVTVVKTDAGQAIKPVIGEPADLDRFRDGFFDAFGTVDEIVAKSLFEQLLNGLHTGPPNQPVDTATANLALALMHSLGPSGSSVTRHAGRQPVVATGRVPDRRLCIRTSITTFGDAQHGSRGSYVTGHGMLSGGRCE